MLLLLLLPASAKAAGPFEDSWIVLEGGEKIASSLSYDAYHDLVYVKESSRGTVVTYTALQLLAFSYGGEEYYSLTLQESAVFFKILHQNNHFAFLQKENTPTLLAYFVQHSRGTIELCYDSSGQKLQLCEGQSGPSFGMPHLAGSTVSYQLENALFIAVEGKLHLIGCRYTTDGSVKNASVHKRNKQFLKRLKKLVKNEQLIKGLQEQLSLHHYNLEDPQQLQEALLAVYP